MKILVLGARGFVGRHIADALRASGHEVLAGVSGGGRATGELVVDFRRDTQVDAWLPRLAGVDAVINAVGVLRDTPGRPMQAVHVDAPRALFAAAEAVQLQKLVHVSALGIAANPGFYARSKWQAEAGLLQRASAGRLNATVLRPSVVFGKGGESSELFLNLARLPLLVLPGVARRTRVQPIHVKELALAAAALLRPAEIGGNRPVLEAVGPQALTLAELIASLRAQQGRPPARLLTLPDGLTRLSARLGDAVPLTPWGTEALSLLSHDSTGDVTDIQHLLGRSPAAYSRLLELNAD